MGKQLNTYTYVKNVVSHPGVLSPNRVFNPDDVSSDRHRRGARRRCETVLEERIVSHRHPRLSVASRDGVECCLRRSNVVCAVRTGAVGRNIVLRDPSQSRATFVESGTHRDGHDEDWSVKIKRRPQTVGEFN